MQINRPRFILEIQVKLYNLEYFCMAKSNGQNMKCKAYVHNKNRAHTEMWLTKKIGEGADGFTEWQKMLSLCHDSHGFPIREFLPTSVS